jgi:hypothetical protein
MKLDHVGYERGINKDIEILNNNQLEMSSSISQIKTSIGSLMNRVKQVENRVS